MRCSKWKAIGCTSIAAEMLNNETIVGNKAAPIKTERKPVNDGFALVFVFGIFELTAATPAVHPKSCTILPEA